MGFFQNKAREYEQRIWVDRSQFWKPYGNYTGENVPSIPCESCEEAGVRNATHGGLKMWLPFEVGSEIEGSRVDPLVVYVYQHLNEYVCAQLKGDTLEKTFVIESRDEQHALQGLTSHLNTLWVSEVLKKLRPDLVHLIAPHRCESQESHDALVIYPLAIENLRFGEGELQDIDDVKDVAMHFYECQGTWYESNAAFTIHNVVAEVKEPPWIKLVPFGILPLLDNMKEDWRGLEEFGGS